jgi:outer membrane receptor protein involved in Fe transport
MRRIPPAFGWLKLSYLPTLNTYVSMECLAAGRQDRLARGDRDDNRIPAGGTPGWSVLNLHAGWTWKRLSVNLSALNLSNEDYRTHGSGINGVGRSLWTTLRYKF